jgi:hypothetical protein
LLLSCAGRMAATLGSVTAEPRVLLLERNCCLLASLLGMKPPESSLLPVPRAAYRSYFSGCRSAISTTLHGHRNNRTQLFSGIMVEDGRELQGGATATD